MTKRFFGFALIIFAFASCRKESITLHTASVQDYFPLEVGKYITYDLDSTIFINFNETISVRHYQAKYQVKGETTDNLGRKGFIIYRYLRRNSSQEWSIDNVFTAYNTGKSIEFIEDNLRFIKLMMPINEAFTWEGNSYLPTYPYPMYQSTGTSFMEDWNYSYDSIGVPLTINSITVSNTIKVSEVDDSLGDPTKQPNEYANKTYSVEKYGKGIGLIYRNFILWEYQAPYTITPGYTGFGEKLTIVDHN